MTYSKGQQDLIILEKLRSQLFFKIENEWQDKWEKYGTTFRGFDNLTSLNAFLEDLLDDIEETIKTKLGLKATAAILISKDSLRRFIQKSQIGIIKLKTRHTIAYYLGYDGWEDFVRNNEVSTEEIAMAEPRDSVIDSEVSFQPHTPNLFRSKFKKIPKKIIVIGVFIFILSTILTSLFLFKSNGTNKSVPRLFRLKSEESRNFPTVAKIEYDFKGLNHSYSYLKQHNEPLDWYMKNDTQVYQLPTFKGECIIYCDKPGLHHIELISNGKAIDTLRIPIRSKDWFGIAYSRSKKTPVDFIYTNRVDWEKLQSDNTKLGFKRKLSIPSTMLNTELCDIRYRSDYFYSGDIDIDGNEVNIEVELSSVSESQSFDCKYFQFGFIDGNGSYNFVYVPISTCSTEGEVQVGDYYVKLPGKIDVDTKIHDHKAKFYFKNNRAYVELDGSLRYSEPYNYKLGKVELLVFSVNNDSKIKHVKLSNTSTQNTVYDAFFD